MDTENTLLEIIARLGALETKLGVDGDLPRIDPKLDDQRLTKAQVAKRYGKSTRGVDRDREQAERGESDFPLPQVVNGRCFWWLSQLQAWDKQQTHPVRAAVAPRNK